MDDPLLWLARFADEWGVVLLGLGALTPAASLFGGRGLLTALVLAVAFDSAYLLYREG